MGEKSEQVWRDSRSIEYRIDLIDRDDPCTDCDLCERSMEFPPPPFRRAEDTSRRQQHGLPASVRRRAGANKSPSNCSLKKPAEYKDGARQRPAKLPIPRVLSFARRAEPSRLHFVY